jgi:hypothetical protein
MHATGLISALPPETSDGLLGRFDELLRRLDTIESMLNALRGQQLTKDWYSISEVAELLGKAPFTVREWCRNRRIHAEKRPCGRGKSREWMVSHQELVRIRNEGLRPIPEH